MNEKRFDYIDVAKAIGIFLIVFGHIIQGGWSKNVLYAFHIPMFFFLSGFLLKPKGTLCKYIGRKFKSLMLPYYFAGIISILIFVGLGGIVASVFGIAPQEMSMSLGENIYGLIYGNPNNGLMQWNRPLWFLPCLFVTEILAFVLEKYIVREQVLRRIISIVILAVSSYIISTYFNSILLPLQLPTAVSMLVWFELGVSASRWIEKERNVLDFAANKVTLSVAVVVFMVCSYVAQFNQVSTMTNTYKNFPLYILNALLMILAVLCVSYNLQEIKWLKYIGKHTLIVLMFHKFPVFVFRPLFKPTEAILSNNNSIEAVLLTIPLTIICITVCLLGGKILNVVFDKIKSVL